MDGWMDGWIDRWIDRWGGGGYVIIRKSTLSSAEHYQVLGRVVHMDFVRKHLVKKEAVDLDNSQDQANFIGLDILADTVYNQVLQALGKICPVVLPFDHGNVAIDAKSFTVNLNTLAFSWSVTQR